MQRHYKHRVPIERNVDGPRVNLTWRWIVMHDSDCPFFRNQEPDDSLPSSQSLGSSSLEAKRPLKRSVSRDPKEEAKRQRRAHRFGQDAASVPSEVVKTQLQMNDPSDNKNHDKLGRAINKLHDLLEEAKSKVGGESAEVLALVSQIVDATKKLRQGDLLPREIESLDDLAATASAMKAEAVSAERSEGIDKNQSSCSSQFMQPSRPVRVGKARADSDSPFAETSSLPRAGPAAESAKSGRASREEEKRRERALRFAAISDDKTVKYRDRSRVDASQPAEASQKMALAKTFEPAGAAKQATYSKSESTQVCNDRSPEVQPALSSRTSSKTEQLVTKTRSANEAMDTTAKSAVVSLSKDAPTHPLSEAERRKRRAERFGTA